MMNNIFPEYIDRFIVVYLDDILIFFENLMEQFDHVRLVLVEIHQHELFAKKEK